MRNAVVKAKPQPTEVAAGQPLVSAEQSHFDRLTTPVWIFDIDRSRVVWANHAGLEVWRAESLAELVGRDLGKDMSVSVAKRLKQYQEDFENHSAAFSELWTLYPKGEPKTLRVVY